MEDSKKKEFYPKNLRMGCHFYDGDTMEMDVYTATTHDIERTKYLIPLRKEVLEAMGFEPVYDEYNHDMYFQRDYCGYRLRTYPMDGMISITDLKYLHTVVNVKAEGLNELENFMYAVGLNPAFLFDNPNVLKEINKFGKEFFDYFDKWGRNLDEYMRKCEEKRNAEEDK